MCTQIKNTFTCTHFSNNRRHFEACLVAAIVYEYSLPVRFPQRTVLRRGLLSQKRSSEYVSSTQKCTTCPKQDGMFFPVLLSGWRGSTTGLVAFPQGVRRSGLATLPDRAKTSAASLILALRSAQDAASTANLPTHKDRRRREERKEHVKIRDETGVQRWRGQWEMNRKKLLSFGEPGSATLSEGQLLVPGILHQYHYTWLHAS